MPTSPLSGVNSDVVIWAILLRQCTEVVVSRSGRVGNIQLIISVFVWQLLAHYICPPGLDVLVQVYRRDNQLYLWGSW